VNRLKICALAVAILLPTLNSAQAQVQPSAGQPKSGASAAGSSRATTSNDVARPIQNYIRAQETGNPAFIEAAFWPEARVRGEFGGNQVDWSVRDYMARFSGSPAADERARRRSFGILEVTGNAAVARVTLNYPTVTFVDYMSLLRVNGEWRIIAKTFNAAPKP
jgi:hypothetical protein